MCGTHAHRQRTINLGPQFNLRFPRIDWGIVLPVVMKISVVIHQRWHLVTGRNRTPSVINSLGGQREVQSEINIGMRLRIVGHLRKPRTGCHQAGGIDGASLESLYGRRIYGVGFTKIVGVNNDQLGVGRISETLRQGLCRDRRQESG